MKAQFFLIPMLLFSSLFYASDTIKVDSLKPRVVGFSPSKNVRNVNGVLFKYFEEEEYFIPKKVNGLGIGGNFLGVFFPALLFFNLPDAISKGSLNDDYEVVPENKMNKINGVQLSLINMEPTVTNGLEINVSSNLNTYAITNGVAVSPLYNLHHEIKGVSVAPFANVGQKCRGLQIGLYNSCKDFRGIQIGAWNENGKRKLPFINWNFKKQKINVNP
ncbi:MAG: LA_2272 family surface repeat-containing protein [Chryseobacterium jejuense]|uniref:LA_2272 family surface repeat-containing protein n=1 Tax=Chryseobacterium jejuense TaxID=445960 RepID=UPI003D14070C